MVGGKKNSRHSKNKLQMSLKGSRKWQKDNSIMEGQKGKKESVIRRQTEARVLEATQVMGRTLEVFEMHEEPIKAFKAEI